MAKTLYSAFLTALLVSVNFLHTNSWIGAVVISIPMALMFAAVYDAMEARFR